MELLQTQQLHNCNNLGKVPSNILFIIINVGKKNTKESNQVQLVPQTLRKEIIRLSI